MNTAVSTAALGPEGHRAGPTTGEMANGYPGENPDAQPDASSTSGRREPVDSSPRPEPTRGLRA
jgi:hypothetical protein